MLRRWGPSRYASALNFFVPPDGARGICNAHCGPCHGLHVCFEDRRGLVYPRECLRGIRPDVGNLPYPRAVLLVIANHEGVMGALNLPGCQSCEDHSGLLLPIVRGNQAKDLMLLLASTHAHHVSLGVLPLVNGQGERAGVHENGFAGPFLLLELLAPLCRALLVA